MEATFGSKEGSDQEHPTGEAAPTLAASVASLRVAAALELTVKVAGKVSEILGNRYVGTEHLLLALCIQPGAEDWRIKLYPEQNKASLGESQSPFPSVEFVLREITEFLGIVYLETVGSEGKGERSEVVPRDLVAKISAIDCDESAKEQHVEPLTERANKVLKLAKGEMERLSSGQASPSVVIIESILSEGTGVAAKVLESIANWVEARRM